MLRFDMLQLDCNDHLYIYDGAHAVGEPKVSFGFCLVSIDRGIEISFIHNLWPEKTNRKDYYIYNNNIN